MKQVIQWFSRWRFRWSIKDDSKLYGWTDALDHRVVGNVIFTGLTSNDRSLYFVIKKFFRRYFLMKWHFLCNWINIIFKINFSFFFLSNYARPQIQAMTAKSSWASHPPRTMDGLDCESVIVYLIYSVYLYDCIILYYSIILLYILLLLYNRHNMAGAFRVI